MKKYLCRELILGLFREMFAIVSKYFIIQSNKTRVKFFKLFVGTEICNMENLFIAFVLIVYTIFD